MNRWIPCIGSLAALLLATCHAWSASAVATEVEKPHGGAYQATPCKVAPNIDGANAPGEWDDAGSYEIDLQMSTAKGDAAPARRSQRRKRHQMQETEWGQQVRGLRVKLAVQTGSHSVGEPIPATMTIENLGTPDLADGAAQLFPHLNLLVRRAGWEKRIRVRLEIENRVRIKKNESFTLSWTCRRRWTSMCRENTPFRPDTQIIS